MDAREKSWICSLTSSRKKAMTPKTKYMQTILITMAAVIIVMAQKDMFF